jgi:hypothetical protein
MPLTAKPSRSAGIYESTCCRSEVRVSRGQPFPTCPSCRVTAVWLPVRTFQDLPESPIPRGEEWRQGDRRAGDERRAAASPESEDPDS